MWAKTLSPRLIPALFAMMLISSPLFAAKTEAPGWMHALVTAPLPPHDEKDNAVLLYSEENLTVVSTEKFHRVVRQAYKILRPEGRGYGTVAIYFNSLNEKVTSIHAWCIPANGKDYEVTDKDAKEQSPLMGVDLLMTDERRKLLSIPAPDPGNIVGFEYVKEERPLVLQDTWDFQETVPVRESHYSLTLPGGWEFKDAWANYPEVKPQGPGGGIWQWTLGDLKEIRTEENMPPWRGLAGRMVVSLFPPGGAALNSFPTWNDVAMWQNKLASGRRDASPEIKQEVTALTASSPDSLAKMQTLALFMQQKIRYVAIELGIGGWQPHPAGEIYDHRYGDCKDKVNLMISMLRQIGVEAYDVRINITRGSVTPETPPHLGFNHSITAIKLPEGMPEGSLIATINHPKWGKLLFFDPTDETTPFGMIRGDLQANYGLLITPDGGELIELPQQASATNGIRRTGKLTLTFDGTLRGDVDEVRSGDIASIDRERYISAEKVTDQIKPVEQLLSDSLATFQIGAANASHAKENNSPFVWDYSFQSENYAKYAGNLLLVRPRVLGKKAWGVLETAEPRRYPIEFKGPEQDIDDFEITLPPRYVVDDLPPAVDADFGFASYHSKTEIAGNVLRYHRTYEVKQLSVPLSQAPDLKKFYRIIASDERNTAVLKLVVQ